jgi:hypothetical protein
MQQETHTTGCTFDSSCRTSRACAIGQYTRSAGPAAWLPLTFSHSLCTSLSASCLHVMSVSIQPSSVGIVAGSEAGADDSCICSGILTSSMLVSMVAVWVWTGGGGWPLVDGSCRGALACKLGGRGTQVGGRGRRWRREAEREGIVVQNNSGAAGGAARTDRVKAQQPQCLARARRGIRSRRVT